MYAADHGRCRVEVTRAQWRTVVRAVVDDLARMTPVAYPPVVGLKELARIFEVRPNTPCQWHSKDVLPREDGLLSGNPVWKVPTIYAWAANTGRTMMWHPWPMPADAADAPMPPHEPVRAGLRAVADDLITPGPLTSVPVAGMKEIVRMFDVKDNTPYQWRSKHKLVSEDGLISNNPVYKLPTIRVWAQATRRVIVWDPWASPAPEPTPV
jgi:hypothetical protein